MPTFKIIIYIRYRSISLINLFLLISPAVIKGLGIGAKGSL
jgi:hypothetical protein